MYARLRSFLFRVEPERVHDLTLHLMRVVGKFRPLQALVHHLYSVPAIPVKVFGLTFSNPVGLAAGYDKDGIAWRGLACLGFGHIEVGTVTPAPQDGNPRPRIFRLVEDQAIINRMGFPNRGASYVASRLGGKRPLNLVLGVNLGKGRDTPLEQAAQDYRTLMRIFSPLADYLTINVSSPNTIGLRSLQARQALSDLLTVLVQQRKELKAEVGRYPPLLLKLAPDLTDQELDDALQVMFDLGMDGVIATNTSIGRKGVRSPLSKETGGLSGAPLHLLSLRMVRQIYQRTGGRLPIVAAGGILCAADAKAMLDAGASLVQVYTGLVYRGPGLVKEICSGLREG